MAWRLDLRPRRRLPGPWHGQKRAHYRYRRLVSYRPLAPSQAAFLLDVFDRAVDICRQRSCANCCSSPALAELELLASAAHKCSTYMAVRTRSGRRSGATPLNGGADNAPYECKLDALLTVVYLAVLYYWR